MHRMSLVLFMMCVYIVCIENLITEKRKTTMDSTKQTLNLHQQALEKIINIQSDGTVDWYRFVLTILKNDPQAILNAFPKILSEEEQIEGIMLKMLVPNQDGIICSTIPAIKRYRELTGADLCDAKTYVESLVPKAKGLHS